MRSMRMSNANNIIFTGGIGIFGFVVLVEFAPMMTDKTEIKLANEVTASVFLAMPFQDLLELLRDKNLSPNARQVLADGFKELIDRARGENE